MPLLYMYVHRFMNTLTINVLYSVDDNCTVDANTRQTHGRQYQCHKARIRASAVHALLLVRQAQ